MAKGESEYDNGHVPHSKGNAIAFFQSDDVFMIMVKFLKD